MNELIYNQCNSESVTITGDDGNAVGVGEGDRIFSAKMPGDLLTVDVWGSWTSPNVAEPVYTRKLTLVDEESDSVLSVLQLTGLGASKFHAHFEVELIQAGESLGLIRSGRIETPSQGGGAGLAIAHAENDGLTLMGFKAIVIGLRAGSVGPFAGAEPQIIINRLTMRQELSE